MRELILATHNRHKVVELAHALHNLPVVVRAPDARETWPEVEETGATLAENAWLKAEAALRAFPGRTALADDTGLEVDALGGAPGVHSSRYAGEGVSYADNVEKLLRALAGVEPAHRTARFRCVLAIADPEGRRATVEGVVEGRILTEPRGEGGFGYDPVFWVPDFDRTFSELTLEEKGLVSHRGRALRAAREILGNWYPSG